MSRKLRAFFAALLISFTYILPPVSARAEDAGVLGVSGEVDDTGADIPGESEDGKEIPEAMAATPTSSDAFIAPPAAGIAQSGLIDSYDKLREQLDEGVTELELGANILSTSPLISKLTRATALASYLKLRWSLPAALLTRGVGRALSAQKR